MRVPASDHSTGIVLSGKRALRLKDAAPREVGIDLRRVCLATFPQAPYDPGRRVFPGPVLTLAFPFVAFLSGHETLRLTPITPRAPQFAPKLVLL